MSGLFSVFGGFAKIWGWKIKLVLILVLAGLAVYLGALLVSMGREKVHKETYVSETEKIPVFEVAAYRINSKSIGKLTEDKQMMGLTIGTATLMYTYDAWVTLGVRDPEAISIRRVGDELFIDASTINVQALDSKTENYQMIGFDTSNVFVSRSVQIETLFGTQKDDKGRAEALAIANENISAAKANFMDNYEKLCSALGLNVTWL
jgi:hypothetical protein